MNPPEVTSALEVMLREEASLDSDVAYRAAEYVLGELATAFAPKVFGGVPKGTIACYARRLREVPLEDLRAFVDDWMTSRRDFPLFADIREWLTIRERKRREDEEGARRDRERMERDQRTPEQVEAARKKAEEAIARLQANVRPLDPGWRERVRKAMATETNETRPGESE